MATNFCAPLIMDEASAIRYCARHVCGECLGTIQPEPFKDELFIIQCRKCGNTLREGGGIREEAADAIRYNRAVGERQMKDDKPMSVDQAIKDLGF